MKKRLRKKAQLNLSFGMIFSIILIVVFLAFAFWAIKWFLGFSDCVQGGDFIDAIQNDVDRIWRGQQGIWSPSEGYILPSKIEAVCFVDFFSEFRGGNEEFYDDVMQLSGGNENMIFYPAGSSCVDSVKINNIDLEKITENENPYCVENKNGKLKLTISKNYGENLVTITRNG